MDSILTSIKKLLGITEEQHDFDVDIVMHINSVLTILTQLGVGPSTGFSIIDEDALWSDFLSTNNHLELIKSYMFVKVKLLFDPPASSVLAEVMKENAKEMEWRITLLTDESGD